SSAPTESFSSRAARQTEAISETAPLFSLPGPWTFGGNQREDVTFSAEANPGSSFVVTLSARCDGGKGFRSPLTSRDEKPTSGYLFYVDNEEKWSFWVGDGVYWAGLQGPAAQLGTWAQLRGVVDIEAREVSFYVDGVLAGHRPGVDFVANLRQPLRLGAGRSESPDARYFFHGSVKDLTIHQLQGPANTTSH
ncbi:unnamed protein product, partial [Polarella glacialis]